jgi:uncharacterized Zn-finger protein
MAANKDEVNQNNNKRPYPCTQCELAFKKAASLAEHVRDIHSPSAPLEPTCQTCGKSFGTKQALKRHEATHGKLFSCRFYPIQLSLCVISM